MHGRSLFFFFALLLAAGTASTQPPSSQAQRLVAQLEHELAALAGEAGSLEAGGLNRWTAELERLYAEIPAPLAAEWLGEGRELVIRRLLARAGEGGFSRPAGAELLEMPRILDELGRLETHPAAVASKSGSPGGITGTVTEAATGLPIDDGFVYLYSPGGWLFDVASPDATGSYTFVGLPVAPTSCARISSTMPTRLTMTCPVDSAATRRPERRSP